MKYIYQIMKFIYMLEDTFADADEVPIRRGCSC